MAKRDFSSRAMSSKGHMTLFSPAVFKCIHISVNHVSIFVQAEVLLTRGDYPQTFNGLEALFFTVDV